MKQVRHDAADGLQHRLVPVERGNRVHQTAGIRMQGGFKQRHGIRVLHNTAGIHDIDVIAGLRNHAQVMADQENAGPVFAELTHQAQNLRLYGHVQGGGGFVRDQKLRPADHSHRDQHTLPQAA